MVCIKIEYRRLIENVPETFINIGVECNILSAKLYKIVQNIYII